MCMWFVYICVWCVFMIYIKSYTLCVSCLCVCIYKCTNDRSAKHPIILVLYLEDLSRFLTYTTALLNSSLFVSNSQQGCETSLLVGTSVSHLRVVTGFQSFRSREKNTVLHSAQDIVTLESVHHRLWKTAEKERSFRLVTPH